ncbi:MAG TPA: hypothetical protein VIL32_14150, partial [Steroidobacteraceae bacterium]
MARTKLLILALALPVLAAHAADTPVRVKQPAALPAHPGVQMPVRIFRKPISLPQRLPEFPPPAPVIMSKSAIDQLIKLPTLPATTVSKAGTTKPAPPSQRALVIILENGGLMHNVDPTLRAKLNVNIRTATCGEWEFELRQGESIASLISRVASLIGNNLQCLDPARWRIETLNLLQWLNQQTDLALENAVKAHNSLVNTQNYYQRVVVMEDEDAVPQRVVSVIRALAPNHVIDIHVLTHGDTERFVGYNGASFNAATFFNPLMAEKNAGRLHIRAVYQMNCRGGTLKDNWTALGAITVNGTEGENMNNMPFQYFHWMMHWLNRMGHADASNRSFQEASAYA